MKARQLAIVLIAGLLSGCTAWTPGGEDRARGDRTQIVLPATVICLFSACDTVLEDKEASVGSGDVSDKEEVTTDQTAESTPTISLPGAL